MALRQDLQKFAPRLRASRDRFVEEALARADGVSLQLEGPVDATYLGRVRETIGAGYDYLVAAIESPEGRAEPVPLEILSQARLAATLGTGLEVVLKRCVAVNSLLTVNLMQELDASGLSSTCRSEVTRIQGAAFQQVLDCVIAEYNRERDARAS